LVPDRIEREIVIDAPVDVVWAVVTEPELISGWLSDSVELDLRPDGVETGFAQLAGSDDDRREHFDGHRRGWELELGHLVAHVTQRTQESADR
jgi:uncharacterized protein YndB with AHSA1/START domain